MCKRIHTIFPRLVAVVLCVWLPMLLLGCGIGKRTVKETEETTYGIDVARYQGTIDWKLLGDSGLDFAIVRLGNRGLSSGLINEDPNARFNMQEAAKAGIPLGAYFFSTAITEEEAIEEATWAAEIMAKYPITYPVVYDCENFRDPESRHYGLTNTQRTDIALAFLTTIEELGYEGMFYSSKNEMNMFWEVERIETDYKIWVAQYPLDPYPQTPESSYEGIHHMWQYTNEGQALGISQPVDLNVAYFGYDGIEKPKDPVPPDEVEADVEAMQTFQEVDDIVTALNETNLRNAPSTEEGEIKAVLKNGEHAQRIAVSSGRWSKVIYQGEIYYAHSDYLLEVAMATVNGEPFEIQTQFTPVNEVVTAKNYVNLRNIPSVDHPGSVPEEVLMNGDTAIRTGVNTDVHWSRVEYNGKTLYCLSKLLVVVDEESGK